MATEQAVSYVVQTMSYVVGDGKSNWLEGLILVCKLLPLITVLPLVS